VRVIDDVQRREYALPIAARERPDLIRVASELPPGAPLVPLVRDLRAANPHSWVVALGQPLEPEARHRRDDLDKLGVIHWIIMAPEALWLMIAAVSDGKVGRGVSRAPVTYDVHPDHPLAL